MIQAYTHPGQRWWQYVPIPADRQTIIPMTLGCIADVILIVCGTIWSHSGMIWCHLCDRHARQSMGVVLTKYPFGSAPSTTKAAGLQVDGMGSAIGSSTLRQHHPQLSSTFFQLSATGQGALSQHNLKCLFCWWKAKFKPCPLQHAPVNTAVARSSIEGVNKHFHCFLFCLPCRSHT